MSDSKSNNPYRSEEHAKFSASLHNALNDLCNVLELENTPVENRDKRFFELCRQRREKARFIFELCLNTVKSLEGNSFLYEVNKGDLFTIQRVCDALVGINFRNYPEDYPDEGLDFSKFHGADFEAGEIRDINIDELKSGKEPDEPHPE